jgi:Protein of unknown function (DUF3108)
MLKRLAFLIAMTAPLVQPVCAAELQPFSARFAVTWHGITAGHSQLELKRLSDSRWSYASRSTAQGLFRLALPADLSSRSEFSIRNGQIMPEHFSGDDGTDSKRRSQDMVFDWERGRVTGIAEMEPVDLPLQPGLLDGMTVQIAMMHALLSGHTPSHFLMVDKTKIKDYIYTEEGTATIQTAIGPRRTILYRSSRPGSADGTWFWCAPDMRFLPVKVERRNGKKVAWSMTLESATLGDHD